MRHPHLSERAGIQCQMPVSPQTYVTASNTLAEMFAQRTKVSIKGSDCQSLKGPNVSCRLMRCQCGLQTLLHC
eukprot:6471718-Amphidinium_carterae.1